MGLDHHTVCTSVANDGKKNGMIGFGSSLGLGIFDSNITHSNIGPYSLI